MKTNDFSINIATVNGSGSQSANSILVKTLFRMGLPVAGKNLFPSNIQGLPTWFSIRANPFGFVSRSLEHDVVVTLNASTAVTDQKDLRSGGIFFYAQEINLSLDQIRKDIFSVAVPFKELSQQASESIKVRKLLANVVYVGILAEYLKIDMNILKAVVDDQFAHKGELVASNLKALEVGQNWARENMMNWPRNISTQVIANGNQGQLLIDGNTAAGMGLVDGGCTFASWYPITPSSSLMESTIRYADLWRRDANGSLKMGVVQAEDELAAISMVVGAGWAGARAATATSGPGLSLMSEAAGLAYFAEIPSVIWDVQRAGPSTGLPTRTLQGDIQSAAHLSHGDTEHVLLFPGSVSECFSFGQLSLDLAEMLQTLVIVLSDLDLGMNFHRAPLFEQNQTPLRRGKVLSTSDLDKLPLFARYSDPDGDGIGPRTLPGTEHEKAAYFTRGTGHDDFSRYTEDPAIFKKNLDRLKKKLHTARSFLPAPEIKTEPAAKIGIIYFGSTSSAIPELEFLIKGQQRAVSTLRLRSFPFHDEVEQFILAHTKVFVVEQNRDGQMRSLLGEAFPECANRLDSILSYDGWPVSAEQIFKDFKTREDFK